MPVFSKSASVPLTLLTFFLSFVSFCASQEGYSCTRIVEEKDICKIYNYRHPSCKRWDHTHCPPPRVIRDRTHCVSFKCRRVGENGQLPVGPNKRERKVSSVPKLDTENRHNIGESATQAEIDRLRSEIAALRTQLDHESNKRERLRAEVSRTVASAVSQELDERIEHLSAQATVRPLELEAIVLQKEAKIKKTKLQNTRLKSKKVYYKGKIQRLQNKLDELRAAAKQRQEEREDEERRKEETAKQKEAQTQKDITTVRSLLNKRCPQAHVNTKLYETIQTFVILDCANSAALSFSVAVPFPFYVASFVALSLV